ncbi:MAG: hypothetical protein H6605_01770 [Flavobacteriales bacterium]|nr:hypothetical protein [Flavobacteriales bacterium]
MALFVCLTLFAQEKPLKLSFGTLTTELRNNALNLGIDYARSFDSIFKTSDIFLTGSNHLFQISPDISVLSGTEDAFSAIEFKMSGMFMFFKTKEIFGILTPCTDCPMHIMPVSAGLESNSTFSFVNFLLEYGYVPWYQSPKNKKLPNWIKKTKCGIFLQGGYKTGLGQTVDNNGGAEDESNEKVNNALFRAKVNASFDSKRMLRIGGSGIGFKASANLWYDFLNTSIYHNFAGTMRFFLSANSDNSFDLNYSKGSGAPNFNQGEQFGAGITLNF